jgi:serine/threonine-protein kinase
MIDPVKEALTAAGWNGNLVEADPIWDSQPIGTVLQLEPAPGETVNHNETLRITTSKGPEPVELPDLTTGLTLKEAVELVKPLDLSLTESGQEYSEDVPKGQIITQSDPPGPGLHRGDSLTVVVSKGREPIEVPNVARMSTADATALLESKGFRVVENVYTPGGLPIYDEVTYTDPEAGTLAYRGDTITLYIT